MKYLLIMISCFLVGCQTNQSLRDWFYSDAIQITLSKEAVEKEKSIVVDVVIK